MRIDIPKAQDFLAEIMRDIRSSPTITSNDRQAELMGLSYGTVRSLLKPSSAVKNLPDHPTLDAIAKYRGQRLSDLIREMEDLTPSKLNSAQAREATIANMLQCNNIDDLVQIAILMGEHMERIRNIEQGL